MVSHRALKVTGFQRGCPLDLVLLLSSSLAYQFHVRHWITSFQLFRIPQGWHKLRLCQNKSCVFRARSA